MVYLSKDKQYNIVNDVNQSNPATKIDNHAVPVSKGAELINACNNICKKHVHMLVKFYLDNADDALYQLAKKTSKESVKALYYKGRRELKNNRENIEKTFNKNIADTFNSFWNPQSQPPPPITNASENEDEDEDDFANLQLVDNEDLDESLAITSMARRVQDFHMPDLFALGKRLTLISKVGKVDENNLPYAPLPVCQAFRDAVQAYNIDVQIRIILYKLFGKNVLAHIGAMYGETNEKLINAGILPKLKSKVKRRPVKKKQEKVSSKQEPDDNKSGQDLSQNDVLKTLHQLLEMNKETLGSVRNSEDMKIGSIRIPRAAPANGTPISTEEVFDILSNFQFKDSAGSAHTGADLKNVLLQQMKNVPGYDGETTLQQLDENIIDFVCMLFEFILDDDSLPYAVKTQIGKLQIPILKVAVTDNDIIKEDSHPARKLLNELAKAGMGLDESSISNDNEIYNTIKNTVRRVQEEFKNNIGIFSSLLDEFVNFMNTQRRIHEEQARLEAVEICQQREEEEGPKQWVTITINEKLIGKKLLKPVNDLITGPWQDVLIDTYIKKGKDSSSLKEQLRFIDILLWSVQPKTSDTEKQKLARVIPQLVNGLRRGLEYIKYPENDMKCLLKFIELCHKMCLQGKTMIDEATRDDIKAVREKSAKAPVTKIAENPENEPPNQAARGLQLEEKETPVNTATDFDTIQTESTGLSAVDEPPNESAGGNEQAITEVRVKPADESLLPDTGGLQLEPVDGAPTEDEPVVQLDKKNQDAGIQQPAKEENTIESQIDSIKAGLFDVSRLEKMSENFDIDVTSEDIVLAGIDVDEEQLSYKMEEDEFVVAAREIKTGTWVELKSDSGEIRRGKLIWKSDVLSEYSFVSASHKLVANKTLFGFAADLRRGSAKILTSAPIMDRAISGVLGLIGNSKPTPAAP